MVENERPASGEVIDDPHYPPTAHLERLYREVKERLDTQRAEFDDLQRLVAIVLAAGGVLLGFAGTQFPTYRGDHPKFWLFVAAVIVLALGIVVGGAALWPRRVKITPEPARLIDDYVSTATNIMIYDLIQAGREAYEQNAAGGAATWRSRFVRLQLVGLAAGAVLLAAGVLAPHV